MIIDKKKKDELEELLKPAVKWLCEEADPHAKIIIEPTGAELLSGSAGFRIEEFILN